MEEFPTNKSRKKRRWRWFALIAVVLLLIPFPTLLAPDFTVRFVDRAGNPVVDMKVQESCTHYTYESIHDSCSEDWEKVRGTDPDGKIHFEARYVWFGAASRVVRTIFSHMLLIAHGSVGRRVALFTSGNDSGLDSYVISVDPSDPPKEITLTDEAVDQHNREVSSRR